MNSETFLQNKQTNKKKKRKEKKLNSKNSEAFLQNKKKKRKENIQTQRTLFPQTVSQISSSKLH